MRRIDACGVDVEFLVSTVPAMGEFSVIAILARRAQPIPSEEEAAYEPEDLVAANEERE